MKWVVTGVSLALTFAVFYYVNLLTRLIRDPPIPARTRYILLSRAICVIGLWEISIGTFEIVMGMWEASISLLVLGSCLSLAPIVRRRLYP